MMDQEDIFIFAYGSLCWNPGFAYDEVIQGFVTGFNRRFWQGNITHRGTQSQPGRVATLVPAKDGRCFGVAFRVNRHKKSSILEYLENREMKLGGYVCVWTEFTPLSLSSRKQCKDKDEEMEGEEGEEEEDTRPILSLCYIAENSNSNPFWLGFQTEEVIASEVRKAHGFAGSNSSYVLNLHKYMKTNFPFLEDEHLELIVKYL